MATANGSRATAKTGGSTPKAGGGSNVATAKTGGSTPKAGSGSGGGVVGGGKVSGPTRTTTAVVGTKTVRKCYDSNGWETGCKSGITMSKKAGIIVGAIIGAIVLALVLFILWRRWKMRKTGGDVEETPAEEKVSRGGRETLIPGLGRDAPPRVACGPRRPAPRRRVPARRGVRPPRVVVHARSGGA